MAATRWMRVELPDDEVVRWLDQQDSGVETEWPAVLRTADGALFLYLTAASGPPGRTNIYFKVWT